MWVHTTCLRAGTEGGAEHVIGGGALGRPVAAVAQAVEHGASRAVAHSAVAVRIEGEDAAADDERRVVHQLQAKELPVDRAPGVEAAAAFGHGEQLPSR